MSWWLHEHVVDLHVILSLWRKCHGVAVNCKEVILHTMRKMATKRKTVNEILASSLLPCAGGGNRYWKRYRERERETKAHTKKEK